MAPRSLWKGPYVDPVLLKQVAQAQDNEIYTQSRRSMILPEFVGKTFYVHNGHKYIAVRVHEDMIGHKLGEFSSTRKKAQHGVDSKKKK